MAFYFQPSIVLTSTDFTLYAVGSFNDLPRCGTEYLRYYHCPALLFAFLPINGGVCKVVLTQTLAEKAFYFQPSIVLISTYFTLYAVGLFNDLPKCGTEYLRYYHCSALLIAFLPINGGVCKMVLTDTCRSLSLYYCGT